MRDAMRAGALVVVTAVTFALPVAAQPIASRGYPARPIRVVVPFTPGGGADTVARIVGQKMSEGFGQQLVIDNRVGADGNIGTEMVAHAVPDGYTILLGYVGNDGCIAATDRHARTPNLSVVILCWWASSENTVKFRYMERTRTCPGAPLTRIRPL